MTRLVLAVLLLLLAAGGGCGRAHPRLAPPEVTLDDPAFFPTLEAYTSAPIVEGNAVEILRNGEEIFPAVLVALRGAARSITYAPHGWDDGPVAAALADALAERCRAGVDVRMLLHRADGLAMPASHRELLHGAGCHVAVVPPPDSTDAPGSEDRSRQRLLVVDGRIGFTGSSGVGRRWMGNGRHAGHWRTTDVRVTGPVVEYLQAAFVERWLEATGAVLGGAAFFPRPQEPRGPVYVQAVRSSPAGGTAALHATFLLALSAARRAVSVTTPSTALDEALRQALMAAVRRGARVVLLVPGARTEGEGRLTRGAGLRALLRAGVEIHEYGPAWLATSTVVVDGVWSSVGSAGLARQSFSGEHELNLVVYSAEVARRLERAFAEDLRHATPLAATASPAPRARGPGSSRITRP